MTKTEILASLDPVIDKLLADRKAIFAEVADWLRSDPQLIDVVSSSELEYLAGRIEKELT